MRIKNKRVFVTGGAGFIGSHIVESLLKNGAESIIIYDNFSSGHMDNIKNVSNDDRVEVVRGDILDIKLLKERMEGADIVSHQAAELEVSTGIQNMHHDMEINIEGTLNVLKCAMESQVKKFIFASSGALYGQAVDIPEDERHPLNPHWPYGVSKLAGEKYCSMVWNLHGFPTVSLRYAIVYGPREWYGRVLTLFIKRCLENLPPVVFGDGKQTRDFVFVSDVVNAHNMAIENDDANGKVFNIGSGVETTIDELAKTVVSIVNPNVKILHDDPKEGQESKHQPGRQRLLGELRRFVMDIKQAKEILGYSPLVSLEHGIKMELDWIKNNPEKWDVRPRV